MADSVSYADCRQRANSQRSRWARATEHVATSNPRGGGDRARRKQKHLENLTGQAGKTICEKLAGRADVVGLKYHRPGRSWTRDLKISRAWPGAGWAGRGRPGPTWPHLRELAQPVKTVGFEMLDFSQFENITKRDIKTCHSGSSYFR